MNSQKSWYNNHEPAKQWTNKQKGMLIPSAEVQEIYTTTGYKSMLFYQKILCSPNVEWIIDNKLIIRLIRLVKFQVGLITFVNKRKFFVYPFLFTYLKKIVVFCITL